MSNTAKPESHEATAMLQVIVKAFEPGKSEGAEGSTCRAITKDVMNLSYGEGSVSVAMVLHARSSDRTSALSDLTWVTGFTLQNFEPFPMPLERPIPFELAVKLYIHGAFSFCDLPSPTSGCPTPLLNS